jgi:chitodextrinase
VYRGTTSSNLSQVAIVLLTSYTDQSLNCATKYYYAVEAADTGNDLSPMSKIAAITTPAAPSAPTGLVATPLSTTMVGLTWSVAGSGGLPIRDYLVFRGVTRASLTQLATVLQPAYTDVSGSPATTYYYAVEAVDTGGDVSPMSATVSATTLALPSAPTNLLATAPSKSQVSLTWTAAKSGMPLASYSVYRGSSPSGLAPLQTISATKTAFNDHTVAADTTYYYAVQAEDTGGNLSPLSAVATVTTPE